MKKIVKIFSLIIFIIFVLGITTSKAVELTVTKDTKPEEMLEVLSNDENTLTGITDQIRDQSEYLLCDEKYVWLQSGAKYKLVDKEGVSYPQADSTNGYAKAYILAAPGYIKSDDDYGPPTPADERQWAWYFINGEVTDGNDLSYIAGEYQKYKTKEEKDVKVTSTNAKTTSSGGKVIYGPIQIEYSYRKASSGEKNDEWGGFNYLIFDEKGNDVSSEVKLCTLTDNKYTPITSKKITSTDNTNGYYKVSTAEYNKVNLYLVTSDKNITDINIKIQENKVNYTATVYELVGEIHLEHSGISYCTECRNKGYKVDGGYLYNLEESRIINHQRCLYNVVPKGIDFYYDVNGNQIKKEWSDATSLGPVNGSWCYHIQGHNNMHFEKMETASQYGSPIISYPLFGYETFNNIYQMYGGCGKTYRGGKGYWTCGTTYTAGPHDSQGLQLINTTSENKTNELKLDIDIELSASIEITKKWEDYDNQYELRPEKLKFNVFRSTDQKNWEKVPETEYTVEIQSKKQDTWKIIISGLARVADNGKDYYFKVEEQELVCYKASYPNGNYPTHDNGNTTYWYIDIENTLKHVNIGGYVWLDGQTGIKPAVPNNGIMDDGETRLENILVYLYYKDPKTGKLSKIAETLTDKNGHYEFKDKEIGLYYVEFNYDGIHYEDTVYVEFNHNGIHYEGTTMAEKGISKAFEDISNGLSSANRRNVFNSRFQTITYKKSNDGTVLNYNYADRKSTLITNEEGKTTIKPEFRMTAENRLELIKADIGNINLGLVKRGTDIALSTDVHDAKVTINGQSTDYTFNKEDNSIQIGSTETREKISYNLNIYSSDYNYRIRDYVNTQDFKEKNYINNENSGIKTGDDLKVQVIYKLNLQNQSTENTRVNEVKYVYDEKYTFIGLQDNSYSVQNSGNVVTINLNGLSLAEGETKTLYLVFEIKKENNALKLGDFINKAEITSYSTDKGLIDDDSQPGNFVNNNQIEDDSDTAAGLKVSTPADQTRKITGNVFDKTGAKVNDVIVQLIELKKVNGKTFEYIWQETVSGTDKGLRLNADGSKLEEYKYNKAEGYYEFKGFIPGDYIVRFIYGDGTTYDMTGNVIKYNGQDYKSMIDPNYKAEWYNSSSYAKGASVARDNEARRLETMAYSVDINASKGVLLKLLNNPTVDDLNKTEKEIIIATYNYYYEPKITEVTSDVINKLLKEQVLKNTWMCAETSKIKVAVDTEESTNTNLTTVNGLTTTYKNNIENVNLGLELRPVTKIELKKYITGFKLTAANGQTLVNAYVDVNEYLNGTKDISNKIQGIRDNVTVLQTKWQYEVPPTEINTTVDGASLEFEYTLVVKNTGDADYLSTELANAYKNSDVGTYKNTLIAKAKEIKSYIRNDTYRTRNRKCCRK